MALSCSSQCSKLTSCIGTLCTVFALVLLPALCLARPLPMSSNVFSVVDYAHMDDTQSLLNAWKDACATSGSPVVSVPEGKTMTLSPVTLSGPCKSSNIRIQVMGTIVAPEDSDAWGDDPSALIEIKDVDGITIDGSGTINGRGSAWWNCKNKGKGGCKGVPDGMRINGCSQVTMTGISFVNSPNIHLGLSDSRGVHISQLSITAPGDSPNTDGIHIQRSQQVQITNCKIGTGDDCVSIGTGTHDVNISQITCGPGHGISIGSLGEKNSEASVSDIRVSNSSFNHTQNGARIKTWQGGSGYVKNVTYEHLIFDEVDHPIIIDQFYCNGKHNCKNQTSAVQISNIKFIDIHGTSTRKMPIDLACSNTVPCIDITIDTVQLSVAETEEEVSSYCLNAHGFTRNVSPTVSCLDEE